jgi:hypothetical protein
MSNLSYYFVLALLAPLATAQHDRLEDALNRLGAGDGATGASKEDTLFQSSTGNDGGYGGPNDDVSIMNLIGATSTGGTGNSGGSSTGVEEDPLPSVPPPPTQDFPLQQWSHETDISKENVHSCTIDNDELHTCISCTAQIGCGWLTDVGSCVNGTSKGPSDRNITEYQRENFWQYGSCRDASCEDYPTCNQCMADQLCGWCSATGKCSTDYGSKHQHETKEEFCPAGWCTHPQGLHPVFHRMSSHSKNSLILDQCRVCESTMAVQPVRPVEEVEEPVKVEVPAVNETLQVEALDRVAGGMEDNSTATGDDVTEKDIDIIATNEDKLIEDEKVAEIASEEACALYRRLTTALEMETNHELAEEENGGGKDLIAAALGETSEHDELEKRVKKGKSYFLLFEQSKTFF